MPKYYTTIQGDMWDSIAYKLYGDSRAMNLLLNANQKYANYSIFPAGITLLVTEYEKAEESNLPPWRK